MYCLGKGFTYKVYKAGWISYVLSVQSLLVKEFAIYTPPMIIAEPITWYSVKVSLRAIVPARMDTTVDTPRNEAALFTPIFSILIFARKKPIIEQKIA